MATPSPGVNPLNILSNLFESFSQDIIKLGALNLAINQLGQTVMSVISPINQAIFAADQFNKQILQSQIAFNIATKEINAFGNEVVSFADRLASTKPIFKNLAKDLEIETQTVVVLTSARLNNVLNEVVQESSSILGQFTDKYGSNTIDIFKKLTANLAATFSLLGSPEFQDPQEVLSLLNGRGVTDPNNFVANKLNLS